MASPQVLYEVADRVGIITLNRPEALNALSGTMREEILQALQRAEQDPAVGCVMLTGAGRAFCAGGDIAAMAEGQRQNDTTTVKARLLIAARVIQQMRGMKKVVIAAINGAAVGGGMNLALACDIRWGSDTARFAQSFVKIGLMPDWAGIYFLPRLVGTSRAMELMITGETITAEEALRLGIISRIIPQATLHEEVLNLARRLAVGPVATLAHIKRGVYLGETGTLEEALEYEQQGQLEIFLSADAREGMRAFLEKRPPVFGREQ